MTVEAVGPQAELLHEFQMAQRHLEILAVMSELAGGSQNGTPHKYRVTHLVVEGHRFAHGCRFGKAEFRSLSDELDVPLVSRTLGKFGEYQMTRKMGAGGFGETVL